MNERVEKWRDNDEKLMLIANIVAVFNQTLFKVLNSLTYNELREWHVQLKDGMLSFSVY